MGGQGKDKDWYILYRKHLQWDRRINNSGQGENTYSEHGKGGRDVDGGIVVPKR